MAWNCGTIASTTSVSVSPNDSFMQTCMECSQIDRWLYTTPLGLPVVPLV